ncbi:MAG: sigma-70 family RNA polymerase sigma factor [Planctomycetota bacterium]|nr:MAG: sigma-70 family RNA polymerase sigma factor [Planctomycetota bacterium]
MSPPSFDPELLARHDAFARALAHRLVHEDDRAEDLSQTAWLAALENPPQELRSWPAWMAAVLRNQARKLRRTEGRRTALERQAPRPEGPPAPDEIRHKEEQRRRLVEAVLALAEPYRAVLLLRYYENLPPREVARRLNVPVETARTRIKRGLEQLRARLDQDPGGRAAWCAALSVFLPSPAAAPAAPPIQPAAPAASSLAPILAMSTPTKAILATAVLAIASLAFLQLRQRPRASAPPALEAQAMAAAPAAAAGGADASAVSLESAAGRAELAPQPSAGSTAPPPFGSLLLHVRWGADQAPAEDIGVRVLMWNAPNPYVNMLRGVTAADGSVRFERVHAGAVNIELDRCEPVNARVQAGEETELTTEVPPGFALRGTVVDTEGRPVANAGVWLSHQGGYDEGRIVARSDFQGRFAVRDVSSGHWLGARADGYQPSLLQLLVGSVGGTMTLELALRATACTVLGRVLDPEGNPVVGATVTAGTPEQGYARLPDGSPGSFPPPACARTDPDGRYRAGDVAPGMVQVAARAGDYAIARRTLEILPGQAATLDFHLQPGVTLFGTVHGAAGEPVKGAEVSVGEWGPLYTSGWSGADGGFRLDGLEAGAFTAHVDGGERGRASSAFEAAPGQLLHWKCTLALGLEISGRVLDDQSAPLAGWTVSLESEENTGEGFDFDSVSSDADGRFRFRNCHDHRHRVDVRPPEGGVFPVAVQTGVRPDGAELLFLIAAAQRPSVRLRGRIVDGPQGLSAAVTMHPWRHGASVSPIETPAATGEFELGPYPPGEWNLIVRPASGPELRLGPKELHPHDTWDLGTIRIDPPGSLRVHLDLPPELPADQVFLQVYQLGSQRQEQAALAGDVATFGALPPGDYQLFVCGAQVASELIPFTILSSLETRLDLRPRAGIPVIFRVGEAQPQPGTHTGRLQVRDSAGALLLDCPTWWREQERFQSQFSFAPGDYHVTATTKDGRRVERALHVAASADPAPLELLVP